MSTDLSWTTQKKKIVDLIPAKYNPRKLTETQEKHLTDSITKFDVADPIVINDNNIVIGGHQRIKILKKMGIDEVDVRVPSRTLNSNEEKELNLRLNKNSGEWDFDLLVEFDEKMLFDVGFTAEELYGADEIQGIELPDGESSGFQQKTFILSDEQAEQVDVALKKAKDLGKFIDTGNENSNGNALARICETFNGQC